MIEGTITATTALALLERMARIGSDHHGEVATDADVSRCVEAVRAVLPSDAVSPAEILREFPDLVVPNPVPRPAAPDPSGLRVGMSYEEVAEVSVEYIGDCTSGAGPECACSACKRAESILCACEHPWIDHGYGEHPGCNECDTRTGFVLASWEGGPPPPSRAEHRAVILRMVTERGPIDEREIHDLTKSILGERFNDDVYVRIWENLLEDKTTGLQQNTSEHWEIMRELASPSPAPPRPRIVYDPHPVEAPAPAPAPGPAQRRRATPTLPQPLLIDAEPVMVPAPALYGPDGKLVLPDEILCIALHQPYASALFGEEPGEVGPKGLETRLWPWSYGGAWLAIFATKTPDMGAYKRLGLRFVPAERALGATKATPIGAILGIVWIKGCRRMTVEDSAAACYPFDPGEEAREGRPRLAWPVGAAYRFREPDTTYLRRGPQKLIYIPRRVIEHNLGGSR